MNLIEFLDKFPDEKSCKSHFINQRLSKGVICKKCKSPEHYWLQNKEQFECKKCRFRTTLRSGTLLQSTKLSYRYWYVAIHLMTATKKGFSAHEMRRQLGHKHYVPIWNMMRKIRIYMGFADDKNLLKDMVELDDAYVSTYTPKVESQNLKRGKGSQKKTKVTVMAESIPLEENSNKEQYVGSYKMKVNTSGNLNPSKQDYTLTEKLKKALGIFDLTLIEHVIINHDLSEWYSMARNGEV